MNENQEINQAEIVTQHLANRIGQVERDYAISVAQLTVQIEKNKKLIEENEELQKELLEYKPKKGQKEDK